MTNLEFAQGLRELADLYERHPEMQVAESPIALYPPWTTNRDSIRATIRAFADGGSVEKVQRREDREDYFYRLRRTFTGGLQVEFNFDRSSVCQKVTKMQMVETWECPDSLLEALADKPE